MSHFKERTASNSRCASFINIAYTNNLIPVSREVESEVRASLIQASTLFFSLYVCVCVIGNQLHGSLQLTYRYSDLTRTEAANFLHFTSSSFVFVSPAAAPFHQILGD